MDPCPWRRVAAHHALLIEKTMREGRHLSEDLQPLREQLGCVADALAGNRSPRWRRELPSSPPGKSVGGPDEEAADDDGEMVG